MMSLILEECSSLEDMVEDEFKEIRNQLMNRQKAISRCIPDKSIPDAVEEC